MTQLKQADLFQDSEDIVSENFEWQVRHLTFLLMTATGIDPERNNLSKLLGNGHDSDNIQAVRGWVRKKICCPSCARTIKLHQLYDELNTLLLAWRSSCETSRI